MKFINCDECEGLGKIEYICYDCNGSGEGYRAGTSCKKEQVVEDVKDLELSISHVKSVTELEKLK